MQNVTQTLKDMTSTKNENSIFRTDVLETSICICGKEYGSKISSIAFGKERILNLTQCDDCYKKQEEEEERVERDKRFLQDSLKKFDRESLMNPKLRQADFGNYHPTNEQLTKAKAVCERYANNFDLNNPINLLLIGNYGTGKSHLSVSTAKEVMEKKIKDALFISTPKLLTKIRSTYNRNSAETEDEIINLLSRVSLLVLDDIGSEQSKPTNDNNEQSWATSKIFEIMDNRIGKHTIFTTNYNVTELQERVGGRNFSRMMENTHVIKMYGDDYRLKDFK